MTPDEDALIPWQVRAWRQPAFRWAAALVTAAALAGPIAWAASSHAERRERRAAIEQDASALEAALPIEPHAAEELFERLEEPHPGEWLAEHREPGQTLIQYMAAGPNRPTPERSTIYLRAVGPWPEGSAEMDTLRDFAAAYFQIPVEIGAPLEEPGVRARTNEDTGKLQWRSDDLIEALERDIPEDAFCVLGVTHVDLWPGDGWNYVFGQASLRERAGVFSFARHDDAFFGASTTPPALRLRRDVRTMTHEIGHMFTMRHCVAYRCNMNGSNSLYESDRQPMHLCPVCAQKLLDATGFNPARRHGELGRLYELHGLTEEAGWTRQRLRSL